LEKGKVVCKALVIGGSAGSIDVLLALLPEIKTSVLFPIVIVLHRRNAPESFLTELLSHKTRLPVTEVDDKERILPGHIYVAPPDYHLLFENEEYFSIDASDKVNYSRPSIDVSFESAAEIFHENLVCILLSGANADGASGLKHVKKNGGRTVVQEPSTAKVAFMPEQAILNNQADLVLTPDEIAVLINNL
jgi:two-component system, chemotaxis family, protein-glutamate methylesterase/glutaminase